MKKLIVWFYNSVLFVFKLLGVIFFVNLLVKIKNMWIIFFMFVFYYSMIRK